MRIVPLPSTTAAASARRAAPALGTMVAMLLGSPMLAGAEAPLEVLEPAKASAAEARKPERAKWTWNQQQAEVTATGELAWKPAPFAYEAGKTVRYIDFDQGKDDNAGTKEAPWKHHPWDAAAAGKAKESKGAVTYVFKRGVVYRGELHAGESGSAGDPIRLTSDPKWGEGEAVIAGSERVTGWKKGADKAEIPDAANVWYADLDFAPRSVWEVKGKDITRIELARIPNWKVSDPEDIMSEWWQWEQPEWWTNKHHIDFQGHRAHIGIDTQHLTQPAAFYEGAIVHTEYGIVMGTPFPNVVEGYDPDKKGIIFEGIWNGDSEQILTHCHYFLEDKPHYLDSAGEFWFDRKGDGGRLYARLPGDHDPNQSGVEAAKRINLIDGGAASHLAITGLTFRFTNVHWDLQFEPWRHKDVDNACVRLVPGDVDTPCADIRIANCRFDHVGRAVRIDSGRGGADGIVIDDNEMVDLDHGAIIVNSNTTGDVKVLRNRLHAIGLRTYRQDHSHAIQISVPATMEVAGNILDRCTGSGIFVTGGKGGGDTRDIALSRHIIQGNSAIDTLLAANDWGGIETWQGGPFYVYNNISGNANGHWWAYNPAGPGSGRLGFAFYHDGGYKNYDFNNVAWGRSSDAKSQLCNQAAFYEAGATVENSAFNNTVYRFFVGTQWNPAGGRHLFLGNIWLDISGMFFQHGALKEDQGKEIPAEYPHAGAAYGRNVFGGSMPPTYGVFESTGKGHPDLADLKAAMTARKPLATDVGDASDKPVVKDAEKHDFHLAAGSAAIDHGVKVFVPWGLSRVVGEWHFRRNNIDPTVLIDNHWHMAPYFVDRNQFAAMPMYDLKAEHITAADYSASTLEDWTDSVLTLNGKDQYAHLDQEALGKTVEYAAQVDGKAATKTAAGKDLVNADIDTGDLLVEVYLQPKAGGAPSVLVAKMADAGYQLAINKAGGVTLTIKGGGQKAELASGAKIADGKWHHIVAEVDRAAGTGAIYTDGKRTAEGKLALPKDASLSNAADLLVGKNADGHFYAGGIDFLRIARGTLADAKTSIEELYDWEFDGPFLRDFAGQPITGKTRDAGAFEAGK